MAKYDVNPDVLAAVRKDRALTVEEAAVLLGIGADGLNDLESGAAAPTLGMLRNMAKVYKRPLATFGQPNPPPPRTDVPDYRTLDGRPTVLNLAISAALDAADYIREAAEEVIEEGPELYRPAELPLIVLGDDPVELAATERERLGITDAIQLEFPRASAMYGYLRTRIEDLGIFVAMMKMEVDDCRGFCLLGADKPATIVVNGSETSPGAQTFTLLHEYCHVLLRAPGVSGDRTPNRTERFCNLFAANFLMPASIMTALLGPVGKPRDFNLDDVADFARTLNVSQQALALRLEELGYSGGGYYGRWKRAMGARPAPLPRKKKGAPPYALMTVRRLGTAFTTLVLNAVGTGAISDVDAYRATRIKPENFDTIRTELADNRQRVMTASGG